MNTPALEIGFSADDYLAWEECQEEKHEYVAGEVFAMVGARHEHVVVTLNLPSALKQRLRGGPCQAYVSDLKLRVEAADAFFYPDVMVSCDQRDHAVSLFIAYPTLIAEVLSDSTAAYDRGDKFAAYRTLPSLQEYVVVDIRARRVETFRRASDGDWLFHEYGADSDTCPFPSLAGLSALRRHLRECPCRRPNTQSRGAANGRFQVAHSSPKAEKRSAARTPRLRIHSMSAGSDLCAAASRSEAISGCNDMGDCDHSVTQQRHRGTAISDTVDIITRE